MAASTTTSALAPEVEQSHASVNEPSMEDILASIRRIIAEDQSNNLGRSSLGGLTRRQQPTVAPPVSDEAALSESLEEVPPMQVSDEPGLHTGPQADMLHHAYEAPAEVPNDPVQESEAAAPVGGPQFGDSQLSEPVYEARDHEAQEFHAISSLPTADEGAEPLMSPVTGASITSSFQTLAESVMLQDPGLIERVMRESMRPLLKAWLDDHLPSIVERLVRAEIERVARGGRARNA